MVQVVRVDLTRMLPMAGSLEFVRAEWWKEAPRFVLLRYAVNGVVQPLGVRLDLDKKAILDSVDNLFLDREIKKIKFQIWEAVVKKLPVPVNEFISQVNH
jgi:hypothetical protein